MIPLQDLKDGQWYDGFVWKPSKKGHTQQGVRTLQWHAFNKYFTGTNEHPFSAHMHSFEVPQMLVTFEPTMESVEPIGESHGTADLPKAARNDSKGTNTATEYPGSRRT